MRGLRPCQLAQGFLTEAAAAGLMLTSGDVVGLDLVHPRGGKRVVEVATQPFSGPGRAALAIGEFIGKRHTEGSAAGKELDDPVGPTLSNAVWS